MNLNEMLLLEGKNWKNYWKEKIDDKQGFPFHWKGTFSYFKKDIQEVDPTASEDSVGNYTDWILREFKKNYGKNVAPPDLLGRIGKALRVFHRNKKAFKHQDIYKYNLSSLADEASEIEEEKATSKIKGTEPDFQHNGWMIVEIKNHRQACNLGSGTMWCITMRNYPEQYYKYKKFGPIFFVVKGNRRWAISGKPREGSKIPFYVWDEQDRHASAEQWQKKENVPYEVMKYLLGRYNNES